MTKSVILLLFVLISYAACDVTLVNQENPQRTSNNDGITLRCKVTAPDVFDRWSNPAYRTPIEDDSNLNYASDGDEHDLRITAMSVLLAGVWTCHSKQGNSVNITLKISPSVVTPAEKQQTLIKDQPGAIYIDIRGYPPPDFVWQKDGVKLNITGRYSVEMNGTLLISKVRSEDAGIYSAVGKKDFVDKKSGDINVTVLVAPSINGTSIQENRTIGGNISFECSASGVPTPTIAWEKDGTPLRYNGGRFNVSASRLSITDIQTGDDGDYSCVATNSVGTNKLTFSLLSVHVPPTITPILNQEVEKGKLLNVICNASGIPLPMVEWSKNGNILPESQQLKSPGHSKLMLAKIQINQSGVYECSAVNAAVDLMGKAIKRSESIQISVVSPPEFQNVTETIHVRLNKPVTIICDAVGIPVPQVKLSRESKDLKTVTAANSTLSSLTYRINETNVNDLGIYTCTASNKLKTIEKSITLSVPLDKPEISVVELTCTSVRVSWSKDTKNFIEVKLYDLKLTQVEDEKLVRILVVSGNTFQKTFTDLEEGTKYTVMVKQKTDADGIGYESSKRIETSICPLKSIHNASITGNTVSIFWPQSKKKVDKYIIKYRMKGSADWMKTETDAIFVEVSDLDYGKIYEFQVFYNDSGKDTPYSLIREVSIPALILDTSTTTRATTRKTEHSTVTDSTREEPSTTVRSPPEKLSRDKGVSGGAIAAIVIVIILLVLIAVDIFCCFFNQCGAVHMCAAACAGKKREKYNVDGSPEEGTKLKGIDEDGKEEPEV